MIHKLYNSITKNIQGILSFAVMVVVAFVSLFGFVASLSTTTFAAPNPQMNYQGKLTASSNVAVPDGTYNMRFWLLSSSTAATTTALWTESLTSGNRVQVTNGLFSVMLGSTSPLTSVDFNQTLYLGVEIGSTTGSAVWDGEMSPRKILGTVPAAFEADKLDGLTSTQFARTDATSSISSSTADTLLSITQSGAGDILNLFDGTSEVFSVIDGGNIGVGTTSPSRKFTVQGGDVWIGGNLTSTGTLTISGLTTLADVTAVNATTTSATSTNLFASLFNATNAVIGSATSTTLRTTTLGVGSDYITDITGTNLSITNGVLNASGDGVSNWLFNGSRLSPSSTVGIGIFASSTIGNGTGAGGLTVSGNSTTTGNQYVGGMLGVATIPSYPLHVVGQCVAADTRLRRRRRRTKEEKDSDLDSAESEGYIIGYDSEYVYDEVMIKDVQAGDEVASMSQKTGELVWSEVVEKMPMGIQTIYKLTTQSGRHIRTTDNHPYFVRTVYEDDFPKEPTQKLYRFEVDMSMKIEDFTSDSIIAIANEERAYTLTVPRDVKQMLRDALRTYSKPREMKVTLFASAIVEALTQMKARVHELIIDTEYTGYDALITRIVRAHFPHIDISIEQVGKKSPAHRAGILVHRGMEKAYGIAQIHVLHKNAESALRATFPAKPLSSGTGPVGPQALLLDTSVEEGADAVKYSKRGVATSDGLWFKAKEIQVGQMIAVVHGGTVAWERITEIEKQGPEMVWDVEIAGTRNFIGNDIVAHNTFLGGGLRTTASSTIGDGTGAGGLTISGGATTTGNAYFGGSVGIGTLDTSSKLSINGQSVASPYPVVRITHTAANLTNGPYALVIGDDTQDANSFRGLRIALDSSSNAGFENYINGVFRHIYFAPNGGNVGIGSTTPSRKLTVTGDVYTINNITAASSTLGYASTTALTVANNSYLNTFTANNGTTTNATSTNLNVSSLFTANFASTTYASTTGVTVQNLYLASTGGLLVASSTTGVVSASTTIGDSYLTDVLTISGGTIGSNNISGTLTTTGTLTIGDGGDAIVVDSSGWDIANNILTGLSSLTVTSSSTLGFASSTALTVANNAYLNTFTATAGTTTAASSTNLFATNLFGTTARFANLLVSGSSTIGGGTGATGLTISGGATTTGNAYFGGSVGIGTNSPERSLHVVYNGGAPREPGLFEGNCDGCDTGINVYNNAVADGNETASIHFSVGGNQTYFGYMGAAVESGTNGSLFFAPVISGTPTTRMLINSQGLVGIGTTSPGSRLTVWGTGTASTTALTRFVNSASTTLLAIFEDGRTSMVTASSTYASTTNLSLYGSLFDRTSSAGTNGMVLQTNGSGVTWVATSTLGITAAGDGGSHWLYNGSRLSPSTTVGVGIFASSTIGGGTGATGLTVSGNSTTTGTANLKSLNIGNVISSTEQPWVYWGGTPFISASSSAQNTFLGLGAGTSTGGADQSDNTFVGYHAGQANTDGYLNTAIGSEVLKLNTTGYSNTAVGYQALYSNIGGDSNNAIGDYALHNNISGFDNQAFGRGALLNNTVGVGNNAIGFQSFLNNTTGSYNIAIGEYAGNDITNATSSIFIGANAGYGGTLDSIVNAVAIGASSQVRRSNAMVLGGVGVNSLDIVTGTSTPWAKFSIQNNYGSTTALFDVATTTSSAFATSSLFRVGHDGKVSIGSSTPEGLFTMQNTNATGSVIAGMKQYFSFANSTQSALYYGDNTYIVNAPNATSTLVGKIIRIEDSTALGNTVRGLEVQAQRGTNTKGENTALSGFGRTFGVRGTTEGDAGDTYVPAGVFAESKGTTQGNALRAYSGTITTSSLMQLFHDTSVFSGTGLLMNFGNSGGSFAPTSSAKFIDLKIGGTSKFTVTAGGTTTIGDGTTANMAGLQIGYGGLCVDNDGSCTATTSGRITAVSYTTANSDLAEIYFSDDDLMTGEIVALHGGLSIDRAVVGSDMPILGVVSTKPGLVMGSDDSSLNGGEAGYPIGLKGRVPVRLSTENGPIKKGDRIMLSSIPGVGMKATESAVTVGIALEDFDGETAYSDGFVNQFSDDLVKARMKPRSVDTDTRAQDGCSFGGGSAQGDTPCVKDKVAPIKVETISVDEKTEVINDLRVEDAEIFEIEGGEEVKVGQAIMFIDLNYHFAQAETDFLKEILSTTTVENGNGTETLWDRLKTLAQNFVDGVLRVAGIKTDELCVGDVCVDEAQFLRMVQNASAVQGGDDDGEEVPPPPPPEEEEEVDESEGEGTGDGEGQEDGTGEESGDEGDSGEVTEEGDTTAPTEEGGMGEEGGDESGTDENGTGGDEGTGSEGGGSTEETGGGGAPSEGSGGESGGETASGEGTTEPSV